MILSLRRKQLGGEPEEEERRGEEIGGELEELAVRCELGSETEQP